MGSRSSLIVDGVSYLVHPQSLLMVTESTGLEPVPVVLTPIGDSISSVNGALQLIIRFAEVDYVYSPSFARTAVIRSSSERGFNEVLKKFEASGHFSAVYHVSPGSSQGYLPPGPYFLCDGGIHQACRLYDDTLDSFIFGVIPDDVLKPKRYTAVNLLSSNGLWKSIPVPSRLYTVRTSTAPLAGARMGIKDIFRLEGTQTTMMSRPWVELYDADEQSADYTRKLIKVGAVIVGKTKMTSFASPEEPTDQWIDFHCPVNPRGDGYQSPSSSSAGAATSLAGYEWLDFSIAGDSAGSVRAPAPCNGLFSLRPSFGSTSMNGIPVNSPAFDTVGQFGRSLGDLQFIVSHTFENIHQTFSEFPSKILIVKEFYPLANAQQQTMTDEFVKILEEYLGVKRTPFSSVREWEKNPPRKLGACHCRSRPKRLPSGHCAMTSIMDSAASVTNTAPSSARNPSSAQSCDSDGQGIGNDVISQVYEIYVKKLEVFRNWFTQNIMGPDSKTLSNAILIMPYGEPHPEYRDEANPPAGKFPTIAEKFISPILHAPQLVLPFAQMPYLSKIGAKGSDLMPIKLATEAFKKAGWPTSVQTGRYMYPVADSARNIGSVPSESLATYETNQRAVQELQRAFEKKSEDFACNAM
ncbi:D-mandelate dehydrogenase [Fusarium denticulatum]|uniref:D-mandelate dehydrogenase n=1 Tax=Fusarium denticulatum TaxID=48507 RepID=A0A8H5T6V0_9HYPO|nr:D-mandelate dehydrogenase [Fusarium denticulatum]